MADSQPDIQSILAALARQQPHPSQTPPGAPSQVYPPPPAAQAPPYQTGPPGYGAPGMGLPVPASSGNLDLSAIRPVNSGTMSFDDSAARAPGVDNGPTPYDRHTDRGYRSRSRSPKRGDYGDSSNSYRDDRRGGQSRDYGRDRSFSPGPRGRTFSPRGSGRERSPLRGGDENSETIPIESSLVGLIIGRQGENLRRIEADLNCRVQFLPASGDGSPFRQCRITGPRQRRAEVKEAINRIIDDSGMGPLNRAQEKPRDPNKGGATALRDGEDHMQIMVPDRTVGLIIGRGGETIRDLQERSGCHINIVGESKSVNGLRPVNLIGTQEAAARAKDFIMEIVDSDSRGDAPPARGAPPSRSDGPRGHPGHGGGPSGGFGGGGQGGGSGGGMGGHERINDAIYVPSDAVGMIIGKGGETIRDMQQSTGCKINVAQSSGPGETQREIALIGTRESIDRAKDAIEEKVEAVRAKGASGGGRGRGHQDHDRGGGGGYSRDGPNPPTNQQQPSDDAADPYAQYGGYQNYVALWYQSLMYQQQGGQGAAAGAPAPGS